MLTIAICDDEKNICDYIENRTTEILAKNDLEAEISIFKDGSELLEKCKSNEKSFDIIFLDIKMKNLNGVECAKILREIGVESLIVFITSSAEYVFSGYEVKAFRYILKTDLVNAFSRVFGECLLELKKVNTSFFTVKASSSVKTIPLSDIFEYVHNPERDLAQHQSYPLLCCQKHQMAFL